MRTRSSKSLIMHLLLLYYSQLIVKNNVDGLKSDAESLIRVKMLDVRTARHFRLQLAIQRGEQHSVSNQNGLKRINASKEKHLKPDQKSRSPRKRNIHMYGLGMFDTDTSMSTQLEQSSILIARAIFET